MFKESPTNLPDKDESFQFLIEALKWGDIKQVISANRKIRRLYELGGFSLNRPNKKRGGKILVKALDGNSPNTEGIILNLFFRWYHKNENKDVKSYLDSHFESESYIEWVKENDIDEESYYLDKDKFGGFCDYLNQKKARIFLFFSPIVFSEAQATDLCAISSKSALKTVDEELSRKLNKLEKRLEASEAKRKELNKNLRDERKSSSIIRSQLKNISAEVTKNQIEREVDLKKVLDLESKLKSYSITNKELASKMRDLEKKRSESEAICKKVENELRQERILKSDLAIGLENQREVNLALGNRCDILENERKSLQKEGENKQVLIDVQQAKLTEFHGNVASSSERALIELVISMLEEKKSIQSALAENSQTLRSFEKLVKLKENEGENFSFEKFWSSLARKELEKINRISQLTGKDLDEGEFASSWLETKDLFEDLEYLLQAKTVLVKTIHEVFHEIGNQLDFPEKQKLTRNLEDKEKSNPAG